MADGASRSARAEVWARLLVASFVRDHGNPFDQRALAELRLQWLTEVWSEDLPWYASTKIAEGGAATLLVVEIDHLRRSYRARGIGDTCLLHVRSGDILLAGPLHRPEDFGRYPALLSTRTEDDRHLEQMWEQDGSYQQGDALLVATDAAAAYLLGASAEVRQELVETELLTDRDEFADWVAHARAVGGMAIDDTTVCVVSL
ncbi:hypothetical protein ACWEKT_34555 [Nocardia takedensis]